MKKKFKFLMEHTNIIRLVISYIFFYIVICIFGNFNIWLIVFLCIGALIDTIISTKIIESYKKQNFELNKSIDLLNEKIIKWQSENECLENNYNGLKTEYSEAKNFIEDMKHNLYELNAKTIKQENLINESTSLNNELQLIVSDYTSEKDKILREVEELHHELDELQNNKYISINDIYSLYQIYLLIRKYNILQYQITINPIHADIYCKMAIYTKISINKELIPNVNYHIDGTDVVL